MSTTRALGRNAAWNVAGMAVEMATGFLVMPFLIAHLGRETYGVWVVIGALSIYLVLLDLGIRGAVGRHVALYRAAGDRAAVNRTVTAGAAVLAALGLVAVAATFAGEGLFFRAFPDVPGDQRAAAGDALRLMGVTIGLFLVGTAFDATLWGLQRFDWLNKVDIPASLLRLGLTFGWVGAGGGLVALAAINLLTMGGAAAAKSVLCFRADPGLRVGPAWLTRAAVRETVAFGSWNLVGNLARTGRRALSPLLIGSAAVGLGMAAAGEFSAADRLTAAAGAALAAATGVLTPHAAAVHAGGDGGRQRRLFLVAGRHAAALAGFLGVYLIALGGPLLGRWVGNPEVAAAAAPVLLVLAAGELLPTTQYVSYSVLVATARHRLAAVLGVVELAAVLGLTALLTRPYGLVGAAAAVAAPGLVFRGLTPAVLGSRAVGVPVREYLAGSVLAPLLCAAPAGLAVGLLAAAYPPPGWAGLIGYSAAYAALFAAGYAVLLGPQNLRAVAGKARRLVRRPPAAVAAGGPVGAVPHPGEE